jgi:hypothetical protein
MEKTVRIPVELTKAQLDYLTTLGYFMRATPAELLVALSFGAVESQESLANERCDALSRDIINYVVERRVPNTSPEILGHADTGEFTCAERRARRAKIDGEPEVAA